MKHLIVFDLDGTLADSKSAIDGEMAALLRDLLALVNVAIISGGDWPQFEQQVLTHLPANAHLTRLSLLPTSGTKFFQYQAGWQQRYAEDFTAAEKAQILHALTQVIGEVHFTINHVWGEVIEDRGSQITYSALGQQAPLPAKEQWDPDFTKRKQMKALLDTLLPTFSVRLGGTTSVDITKPGIDKAYGIRKLRDMLRIPLHAMLFIGDALFKGGNDYPAEAAGVTSIPVRDPQETKRVIQTIIACGEDDATPEARTT